MQRFILNTTFILLSFHVLIAQVNDINLKEFDTDTEYNLDDLLKDASGQYQHTFLITWFDECAQCKTVVSDFYIASKTGLVNLITLNINNEETRKSLVDKDEYSRLWPNAKNLFVDTGLMNPFNGVFSTTSGPLIIRYNDFGKIVFLKGSNRVKPIDFIDTFGEDIIWNNSGELNTLAWDYFEKNETEGKIAESDPELLKAIRYVKQSIQLDKNYYNTDTHASLLYLSGKYTDALKKAKEAIDIAKSNSDQMDYESTTELIQKIIAKM